MTTLKIIATIFILFFASRAYLRFKDKSLSASNFIFWIAIWFASLVFIIDPNLSDVFAKLAGLGRGVDAAFLVAIILMFYLIFRIYIKIDIIDKNLTSLTINLSKILHEKNKNND
jgi:hypothetical protein